MFHKFPAFLTTLFVFICFGLYGCRFRSDLTIVYSNDILGELENCGCDEKQLGSLSRKAAITNIFAAKNELVLNLDAGNLFFSKAPINTVERDEFLLKSDYILKAYNIIRPDALNIGSRDLMFGPGPLLRLKEQAAFPFLSANILHRETGQPLFTPYIIQTIGSKKIGIIGLCGAPSAPLKETVFADPPSALKKWVAFIADKCDDIILLSALGLQRDKRLAEQFPGISLIISADPETAVTRPVRINNTWIIRTPKRGQYLGELKIGRSKKTGLKIKNRLIPLDGSAGESKNIKQIVKAYKTALTAMNKHAFFKAALLEKDGSAPEDLHYLGSEACAECHLPQFENWKSTFHAEAYATLEKEDNHYAMECLPCHTVGYGEPGGFDVSQGADSSFLNVQCESCHGPGSHHSEKRGIIRDIGESGCRTCHDAKNSPQFDYAAYLDLIKCPTE